MVDKKLYKHNLATFNEVHAISRSFISFDSNRFVDGKIYFASNPQTSSSVRNTEFTIQHQIELHCERVTEFADVPLFTNNHQIEIASKYLYERILNENEFITIDSQ